MGTFHSGVALLLLLSGSANAQTSGRVFFQTTTFGMIGLARNQVARLNVLNPGNAYENRKPVCSAEMKFVDEQGHEWKSNVTPVDWDKAVSLQLDRQEIDSSAARIQIRAVLRTAINPPDPSEKFPVMPGSVCNFVPTLEIFDKDSGKTQLILTQVSSIILNTPTTGQGRTVTK